LGSIFGRMGASFDALTKTGVRGWRARMQFNQMASELAFHRCRVSRGLCSARLDVNEIENAYMQILESLLKDVRPR
jgi:hypothetical protein